MVRNGLTDYDQRKLIMMLGLSQYGDTNIQAKLGYGVGGGSPVKICGCCGSFENWCNKVSVTTGVKLLFLW